MLTPGEVMQLPPNDELILVASSPPIRAQKVRYFEDPQLERRVGGVAAMTPGQSPPDDWSGLAPPPATSIAPQGRARAAEGEGGLRREPEPMFEDVIEPTPPPDAEFQFLEDDGAGDEQGELRDVQRRFRRVARQAALDPDDGVEL